MVLLAVGVCCLSFVDARCFFLVVRCSLFVVAFSLLMFVVCIVGCCCLLFSV